MNAREAEDVPHESHGGFHNFSKKKKTKFILNLGGYEQKTFMRNTQSKLTT